MTFLSAAAVSRWLVCGGSAALEETEAAPAERILEALPIVAERKAALEAQGAAVQAALGVRVDIGIITGERGGLAVGAAAAVRRNRGRRIQLYPCRQKRGHQAGHAL